MECRRLPRILDVQETAFLFAFKEDKDRISVFTEPCGIIQAYTHSEVIAAFRMIQKYSRRYYLAGFLSYESGYVFDSYFSRPGAAQFPLLYFGVFKKPQIYGWKDFYSVGRQPLREDAVAHVRLSRSQRSYCSCVQRIQDHIREGDIYQANFSMKFRFQVHAEPFHLFCRLWQAQPVPYGAYLKFPNAAILSLSPELFFKKTGAHIVCRPMKGTMPRGRGARQDVRLRTALGTDVKNRAENLMIVDLIRNDLSKIARPGSVAVDSLFTVQKYRTVFQMVSEVSAKIKQDVSYFALLRALFPSGSVTGAPKLRAMELLAGLEVVPRDIYCGSIGVIRPDNSAIFNVAIRTALLRGSQGELGVGGGITADSTAYDEYKECLLKGKFFTGSAQKRALARRVIS